MMKLKGLFVDDERFPQDVTWIQYPDNIEWTIVRSFQDFSLELAHGDSDYQVYSFDHDIQSYVDGREYTGYDCLKILLDNYGKYDDCPMIEFHTMNPIGRERMRGYLASWAMCHM